MSELCVSNEITPKELFEKLPPLNKTVLLYPSTFFGFISSFFSFSFSFSLISQDIYSTSCRFLLNQRTCNITK